MSNLAWKVQEEGQQGEKISKKIKKVQKSWLSPGEKILGAVFGTLVLFGSVHIVSNQSAIYEVNKDIQDTQKAINEQTKINDDLKMQVSDLSNYERVRNLADRLGLKLNENNVKVVQ